MNEHYFGLVNVSEFFVLKMLVLIHILIWSFTGFSENLIDENFSLRVGLSTDTTSCSVVINQDISSQTQKNKWISCEVWEKLFFLQCISDSKILIFSWKIGNNKVCPLFICCCREDFPLMLHFKMKMCYFSKNTPLVGGVEVLCRR